MMINHKLTLITKRSLKKIFKNAVVQSPDHKENIINIYSILYNAARDEFTEDNETTLEMFLKECFDEAVKRNRKFPPIVINSTGDNNG